MNIKTKTINDDFEQQMSNKIDIWEALKDAVEEDGKLMLISNSIINIKKAKSVLKKEKKIEFANLIIKLVEKAALETAINTYSKYGAEL